MNLWHDLEPGAGDEINTIIEVPQGSHNKYELDKDTNLIKLDRVNYGAAPYPVNYGFIPKTLCEDNDPADTVVLATYPFHPGVLVTVRPVGLMKMTDTGEPDDKLICVPAEDRRWEDVHDIADISQHTLREFKDFWENLKTLKGKPATVTIHGFEGKDAALVAFKKYRDMYDAKYKK